MNNYYLFVDGSVDPKTKTGIGAYLLLPEGNFNNLSEDILKKEINLKKFTSTSSTRLEIENLLWALNEIEKIYGKNDINLVIYSDSQNIETLLKRREKLEGNNFLSVRKNEELKNADLYKDFFKVTNRMNCRFIKIAGHLKSSEKNKTNWIFSLVDRVSRKSLRHKNTTGL